MTKAYTRYEQKQSKAGMSKVATWVPTGRREELLKFAAQLRREGEVEATSS